MGSRHWPFCPNFRCEAPRDKALPLIETGIIHSSQFLSHLSPSDISLIGLLLAQSSRLH